MTRKHKPRARITIPLTVPFPGHCVGLGPERTWEAGDHIPRPETGGGLYLLVSGEARLLHHYGKDDRRTSRLLFMVPGPGLLYEAVGVLGTPANTTAKTTRRSVTVFLDGERIEDLLNHDPVFTAYLLQEVTRKAGEITRHMLWSTFDDSSDALLDFLYERAASDGRRLGGTVRLRISRETLAQDMGTHPRTIIRWLQRLEADGRIEVWHGGVTLLEPKQDRLTEATKNLLPWRKR